MSYGNRDDTGVACKPGGGRRCLHKAVPACLRLPEEIAAQYGVSYPTVRLRLDRLIQKIKMSESTESDPYIAMVKHLAVDDRLDFDTAKLLINEYKKARKEGQ